MNDTTTAYKSVTTSWYVGIDVADHPTIVKIQFVIGSVDHQTSAAPPPVLLPIFKILQNVLCFTFSYFVKCG